jgi:hypothetical protein
MRLVDDLHKLEMGQAAISSTNQHVQIENLKLQPVINNVSLSTMEQYNRSELYNQSALSARFNFDMTSDNYFNYWWKSIYSGTKKVLGIEPKE